MVVAGHVELARQVSSDSGLEFRAEAGMDVNGRWIRLTPAAVLDGHAFDIRVQMTSRRLRLSLEPHVFAGELVQAMGEANEAGQQTFQAVLGESVARGATVRFTVNDHPRQLDDPTVWGDVWTRMELRMSKQLLGLDGEATAEELDLVRSWTRRFVAAVLAIAPMETQDNVAGQPPEGFAEGATSFTRAVRYERDRRNRAAAIAIHGTACMACRMEFGARYGKVAEGFIEVHHTIPLASVGGGYIVDPIRDLVPLCPNCHAVAHRQNPPLTVEEIRGLLRDSQK